MFSYDIVRVSEAFICPIILYNVSQLLYDMLLHESIICSSLWGYHLVRCSYDIILFSCDLKRLSYGSIRFFFLVISVL